MFISVVIPCYNSEATIRECILSIKNQDYQGEYEIVVVDNGSTDCTVDIIKSLGVNKIVMSPNTTVYAARNNAILQSKGEVLALIDSDCVAQKNWLTTGVNAIKYCDVIAGKILPKKSKNKLLYNYDKYVLWSDNDKYKKSKNIAAGNAFIKRKVFDDIGGFIEEYRTAGDSIFSLEARNKGYEIKYSKNTIVYHPVDDMIRRIRGIMREGEGASIKKPYLYNNKTFNRIIYERIYNLVTQLRNEIYEINLARKKKEISFNMQQLLIIFALLVKVLSYAAIFMSMYMGPISRVISRR